MPITIAICDDEKNYREDIQHLIQKLEKNCHIDLFETAHDLMSTDKAYDIYFLDIHLPDGNGMEIAKRIRSRRSPILHNEGLIIFITAFKDYMEDAFDVNAFHYLVKPIDQSKFKTVIERALKEYYKKRETTDNFILVKRRDSCQRVFLSDIFYVESNNRKVILNMPGGTIEHYGKMQDMEESLNDVFFRCHRCYIVNMAHITRYTSSTIRLANGDEILLAKKKHAPFVKAYTAFLQKRGLLYG